MERKKYTLIIGPGKYEIHEEDEIYEIVVKKLYGLHPHYENCCMKDLHSFVREWQGRGSYTIKVFLTHPIYKIHLPGYIHSENPHIFTLQPYEHTQLRHWRIDNIPDIIDNQEPFTQLIKKMEGNMAKYTDTSSYIPGIQCQTSTIYYKQILYDNPRNGLCTIIDINDNGNMYIQHKIDSETKTIKSSKYVIEKCDITRITEIIGIQLNHIIQCKINKIAKTQPSCSHHQQIACMRTLQSIQHNPTHPIFQNIIKSYEYYITHYTIPTPCTATKNNDDEETQHNQTNQLMHANETTTSCIIPSRYARIKEILISWWKKVPLDTHYR